MENKVKGFAAEEAQTYDDDSLLNKGNRPLHRSYLKNFLTFLPEPPRRFMDLGCGTGYFAEVFTEVFPQIEGVCIDGSSEMLNIARQRLGNGRVQFEQFLFEELNWATQPENDLIFSALAIHHMSHEGKWQIFKDIYHNLKAGGVFILFDFFKNSNPFENQLLEYLSCKTMQNKIMEKFGIDIILDEIRVEKIIENDRSVKALEGDNEAPLAHQMAHLKAAGFRQVITIFQDTRLAGIVAYK